ncbi:MAG: C10 family peptidase, partial [Fibromonadaceae bacterium]|nr:C10 family peptidase [Fibromonadaceae bacterium]
MTFSPKNLAFAATIALALTLTTSCGQHSLEELLGLESSSSQPSSSSQRQSDSSQQSGYDNERGIEPPSDNTPIPPSNPAGTVIVAPLLKTTWGTGSPYNPFSTLPDGSRGWIGCGLVASAQIMNYLKYPPQTFDWDNMLNSYKNINLTEQQQNAITTLMHSLYLGYDRYLGYDNSRQLLYRKYYEDAEWEAVIRQQLDLGLPVWYWGTTAENDSEENFVRHAFVIDGYDNAGKFHINPGWGGSYDGWYSLNNIALGEGRSFNHNNQVTINIKPDAGSIGSNEMGLDSFTVNKTTVSQNDGITVVFKIRSFGIFPGGQSGVALVNNSGNIVEVIGTKNYNEMRIAGTWLSTINCSVPYSANAGQYNLRIVTKMNGETDWKIAAHSLPNVPKSIPFTVTADTETGVKGGGYGLWLGKLESEKTTVSINEGFKVSSILKNVSSETFPATAGVALMDYDNNIVAILST